MGPFYSDFSTFGDAGNDHHQFIDQDDQLHGHHHAPHQVPHHAHHDMHGGHHQHSGVTHQHNPLYMMHDPHAGMPPSPHHPSSDVDLHDDHDHHVHVLDHPMAGAHHVNSSHDIESALNFPPIHPIAASSTTNTNVIQHVVNNNGAVKNNSATPTKKQLASDRSPAKISLRSSTDHSSNQNSPARPTRTMSSNSASPSSPMVSPNASDTELTSVLIRNEDPERWYLISQLIIIVSIAANEL